jgi:DNA primase
VKTQFVGFDALKRSVSMTQVLDRYGLREQLHRSGDNLSGPCPIHSGHNHTQFRVSTSRNCWICFGDCNGGGSIIDFVSRKEGLGIRDAALLIQEWFGLQAMGPFPRNGERRPVIEPKAPRSLPAPARAESNPPLRFTLANLDQANPYLMERGLSRETIQTFGIGYCSRGILAGRIAIPIHNTQGQLVAYAGRWPGVPPNGQPRYRLPRGFRKSLELFNLHRAKAVDPVGPLVVVEGFFGCLRVWQAGFRRVVALMGSRMSDRQEELLVATAGPNGRVALLLDEDEAGRKGRAEIQAILSRRLPVKVISVEKPGMQPDQLSPAQLHELLSRS